MKLSKMTLNSCQFCFIIWSAITGVYHLVSRKVIVSIPSLEAGFTCFTVCQALVGFTSGSSEAERQLCQGVDEICKKKKINTGSSDRLPGRPHFPAAIAQTYAFADWMPLKRRVGWGWGGSRRAVLWVGEDGRWRRHFVERPNPLGGSGTQSRYCFCFVPS